MNNNTLLRLALCALDVMNPETKIAGLPDTPDVPEPFNGIFKPAHLMQAIREGLERDGRFLVTLRFSSHYADFDFEWESAQADVRDAVLEAAAQMIAQSQELWGDENQMHVVHLCRVDGSYVEWDEGVYILSDNDDIPRLVRWEEQVGAQTVYKKGGAK